MAASPVLRNAGEMSDGSSSTQHVAPGATKIDLANGEFSFPAIGPIGNGPYAVIGPIGHVDGRITPASQSESKVIAINWWFTLSPEAQQAAGLINAIDGAADVNGRPTTWRYHEGPVKLMQGRNWLYPYHSVLTVFRYRAAPAVLASLHSGDAALFTLWWMGVDGDGGVRFRVRVPK